MSRPNRSLQSAALALGLFVVVSCGPDAQGEPADLLLLFTGTVNGYVEPCGCVAGQIGGIDRLAAYVEDELEKNPASLFVDTGDLVGEQLDLEKSVIDQLPHKAEAFVSTWASIGCSAIAVGEMDLLLLGVEAIQDLSQRHGVPFLCGNLVDAQGNQPFPSYAIVERGGKRIGIFSLLAPRLMEPKAKDAKAVDVQREIEKRGLVLQNWQDRGREIVDELLPKTDMILCASHLGFDFNKKLAKSSPQIDLVFGGHFGSAEQYHVVVGKTPVLVSLVRGSRVDRVEWWWNDEAAYFKTGSAREKHGNGALTDVSANIDAALAVDLQRHEHEGIVRRELAHDPATYPRLLEDKIALLEIAHRARDELPPIPSVNRFAHVQVPMHRDIRRSEIALNAVNRYHAAVHEMWTSRAPGGADRKSPIFVGPEGCVACHPHQVEFWKATRHSFAITALEITQQEVDAECFPCHTVGWGMSGGFLRPGRHQAFENVQCAACHGPTGAHVLGGTSYLDPGSLLSVDLNTCKVCHTSEHDPHFDEKSMERVSRAACPPLEQPSERTPAMRLAAAQAGDLLANAESPRWWLVSDAYRKADLKEKSLKAAEMWCEQRPLSAEAHTVLGERLLEAGRGEEALRHFRFVVESDSGSARGWAGYARSLIGSDNDRAFEAAREAYSLDPANTSYVRLIVEVLVAQNRIGAATELALEFVASHPHLRSVFDGLVDISESPIASPAVVPDQ